MILIKVTCLKQAKLAGWAYFYLMKMLFAALLACCATGAFAQSAFTLYNTDNSDLPDNKVNCLYTDAAENIWIGTDGGLVQVTPGGVWTVYTTADGLPDNSIRSIFVDEDGIIWAGTYLSGLVSYNGTEWTVYDPTNSGLPDYHVKAIAKDQNDTMWIGTSWGLAKWDGDEAWTSYTDENSDILVPHVNSLYIDSNNIVYAGTLNGGLAVYQEGVFSIYWTGNANIGDNTVLSIDEDAYNNKWLATSFGGLTVMTEDYEFLRFTPLTSDIVDWSVDAVRIDHTQEGIIGMSTFGLHIFDNTNWEHYTTLNSDLPDDFINAITIDASNHIWIGTESAGVAVFDKDFVSVQNLTSEGIAVFPNPTSERVLINGVHAGSVLSVYSITGTMLESQIVPEGFIWLSVSDWPQGTYYLSVEENGFTRTGLLQVVH